MTLIKNMKIASNVLTQSMIETIYLLKDVVLLILNVCFVLKKKNVKFQEEFSVDFIVERL